MKITEIRTRVVQWKGGTVPLPPHFCTNPMDLLAPGLTPETMKSFTFHGWLVVEIFTDNGIVGIGNAALAPQLCKQLNDLQFKTMLVCRESNTEVNPGICPEKEMGCNCLIGIHVGIRR
jgi:L-alanine-DL-glutamate epimerase-like enolase superfamily enzyme